MTPVPASERKKKILICGHRNPDADSVMAACALADLKHHLGLEQAAAICPGLLPDKAAWLLEHFHQPFPVCRNDVFPRVRDFVKTDFPTVSSESPLLEAVGKLKDERLLGLPVVDPQGKYLGMLSPFVLLSELLNVGSDEGRSLTGREVQTSYALAAKILNAEFLSGTPGEKIRRFNVYVAAMSPEFFERHMTAGAPELETAVIVGDRPEIHLRVLQKDVHLLIITGNCPVESSILELARGRNVTVLRTACDSATVIRRLKFSMPVRYAPINRTCPVLSPDDMIRDIRPEIHDSREDVFPVCSHEQRYLGAVTRSELAAPPPCEMILVDHNETAQGIPGLEELPVIEVVDHHRIGMRPTAEPIKVTADTVGSTCTLVAGMFRANGLRPSKGIAGLLLGGIVADTLLFQSPTTTPADRRNAEWLEAICGEKSAAIMESLMKIHSPLAVKSSDEVINADRKTYHENGFTFALSQVEESNLELLHRRRAELEKAMNVIRESEKLDFLGLLATDAVRGNSELLMIGPRQVLRSLPYAKRPDGLFLLPGILSRKKQLLPQILSVTAALSGSGC